MITNSSIENRKAIEALRAGVPNLDAVRVMGSSQPELEELFRARLGAFSGAFQAGEQVPGLLVAGDFGNGKSHLLEYFKHVALENNFVCSKIVISKETPLYDPGKVFRAAIEAAKVPNRLGGAMTNIAARINFNSPEYAEFYHWMQSGDTGVAEWFAATVYLYEYAEHDEDIRERITRFWAGEKLTQGELKKYLKDCGQGAAYKIDRLTAKELARQRYLFIPRLIKAAGYAGWVILADEMELIGRYSLKQRARSYAEFARLMGKIDGNTLPGLLGVFSITIEFEDVVVTGRNDEENIRTRYEDRAGTDDAIMASRAKLGIRLLSKRNDLVKLNQDALFNSFEKLRSVYQQAYNWLPPEDFNQPDMTARVRQHIKRWITEWDLKRLYPEYQPEIEVSQLNPEYSENLDLEQQEDETSNNDDNLN